MSETARSLRPYIKWHATDERTRTGLEIDIRAGCSVDMRAMADNEDIVSEVTKLYRVESILSIIYTEQMNAWQDLQKQIEVAIAEKAE